MADAVEKCASADGHSPRRTWTFPSLCSISASAGLAGSHKAQVVQEILKEEKTLNQLAAEHSVHPNQLKRWKAIALEGLPSLFSKDDQAAQAAAKPSRTSDRPLTPGEI